MMRGEHQIRTLMGPADPARAGAVPPPAASAAQLIATAEAVPAMAQARRVAARRPVLAVAAAIVAAVAVAVYPIAEPEPDRPPDQLRPGSVVAPMAYEITDDPPPAADHLRDLAASISDAPYDGRTGGYAHHRIRTWGMSHYLATSPECASGDPELAECPVVSEVVENETWVADGFRRDLFDVVGLEFPDERSRRYFESHPDQLPLDGPPVVSDEPPGAASAPLPTDRGALAELIGLADGVPDFWRVDTELYGRYLVPREVRATVLEILADVPASGGVGR